jgi:hypothetical protein
MDGDTVIVIPDALLKSIDDIKAKIIAMLKSNAFTDLQIDETLKFIVG